MLKLIDFTIAQVSFVRRVIAIMDRLSVFYVVIVVRYGNVKRLETDGIKSIHF